MIDDVDDVDSRLGDGGDGEQVYRPEGNRSVGTGEEQSGGNTMEETKPGRDDVHATHLNGLMVEGSWDPRQRDLPVCRPKAPWAQGFNE